MKIKLVNVTDNGETEDIVFIRCNTIFWIHPDIAFLRKGVARFILSCQSIITYNTHLWSALPRKWSCHGLALLHTDGLNNGVIIRRKDQNQSFHKTNKKKKDGERGSELFQVDTCHEQEHRNISRYFWYQAMA